MSEKPTAGDEGPLHLSAAGYRALVEALPVQVWTARPDGALDFVSPSTAAYFGRSAEQLVGEGWLGVLHPADVPLVLERWTRSLETGEPYAVEFRLMRGADRLYRWHVGRAVAVRDDGGRIVEWIGSNTDVDEQKRALEVRDAALSRAAAERSRFERVFEHSPAAMALYRGREHTVVKVNSRWVAMTGRRDAVGRPVSEVFPELDGQEISRLFDEVSAKGEPATSTVRLLLDRTGTGVREETFWAVTLQPLVDEHGATSEIVSHSVEIKGSAARGR